MPNLRLSEYVVDAAVAKLRAGYGARVTQINAEYDDLDLATPATEDFYRYGEYPIPRVPAVIVTHGGTEDEISEEGTHTLVLPLVLVVAVVDEDQNRSRLGSKLDRHVRAVIECVWDDQPREQLADPAASSTIAAWAVHPIRIVPGRATRIQEDEDAPVLYRSLHEVHFRARRNDGL